MGFSGHFCAVKGNEFFCQIDQNYLLDLSENEGWNLDSYWNEFVNIGPSHILDFECHCEKFCGGDSCYRHRNLKGFDNHRCIEMMKPRAFHCDEAAELLYGLIHARYILTDTGMARMKKKYDRGDFGYCPRVYCESQPLLPMGLTDMPLEKKSSVKMYCPKCEDVYHPRSTRFTDVDGAYFGTSFPHMFLMAYPLLRPEPAKQSYTPMLYGFRVHPEAIELQRQKVKAANIAKKKLEEENERKMEAEAKEKEDKIKAEEARKQQAELEKAKMEEGNCEENVDVKNEDSEMAVKDDQIKDEHMEIEEKDQNDKEKEDKVKIKETAELNDGETNVEKKETEKVEKEKEQEHEVANEPKDTEMDVDSKKSECVDKEKELFKDEKVESKDEKTESKDQKTESKDAKVETKDEKTESEDEKAESKDEVAECTEEKMTDSVKNDEKRENLDNFDNKQQIIVENQGTLEQQEAENKMKEESNRDTEKILDNTENNTIEKDKRNEKETGAKAEMNLGNTEIKGHGEILQEKAGLADGKECVKEKQKYSDNGRKVENENKPKKIIAENVDTKIVDQSISGGGQVSCNKDTDYKVVKLPCKRKAGDYDTSDKSPNQEPPSKTQKQ